MTFEFARPWALLLLPLVPLVLWAWRRRPRRAIAWPGAAELTPFAASGITRGRFALRAAALLAATLAIAGPRVAMSGERLESEGIAIMLVVDVSGSMSEPDFDSNGEKIPRLDALKIAIDDFVSRRPQDRIGLVLFATLPESSFPLTLDHGAVRQLLKSADPRGTPTENDTNLGDAIAWGLDRLRSDTGKKVIVLFSDGEHNVPSPALSPRQAGQLAAAAGVPIYTVDAGPPSGPGRAGLEAIARMTGGQSFAANDERRLANAVSAIDRLSCDVAQSERTRRYKEGDRLLAVAALMCLGFALMVDAGPWLRVPYPGATRAGAPAGPPLAKTGNRLMLNRYFEFPLVLLIAIATAVVLAVFNWRGRKSRAAYCSRLGIAPTQRSRLRVYSLALALILFGLAAAGPRWGGAAQVATAAGSDVAIVLDVSRSMNAKDAMPDRISKARELAAQVVESLARQGGHRVAVIAFAAKPTLVAPLTYDLKFIRAALTDLDPTGLRFSADQPKSGTRIGEGLQAAVASLAHGRPGARMILLFSDGDDPVDDREYLQGAEAAVAAHVPVAVIGIGHDTMESNVPGRPNAKTRLRDVPLRDIAGRTGGRYFSVGSESLDADSLVRAMLMDRRHGEDSNMAIARAPGRPLPFLAAGLVMLIVGMTGLRWRAATASVAIAAMAAGPIDDWLRRGDKALVANRPEQALEYYTKTDGRAPDPGLVAFNQGVALAALSRHREAEEHFRWSLSDATGERRARALYNLGTSMIHRSGGRDRAALHMAIGSLDEALRNIPANDPLATQVQENISVARALIAQLPPEEPNAPAESGPDKSGENNRSGESPGTPKPDSGKANEQSKSGEAPRPTDQPSPGKGTLPPLADSDELSELSSDDLESHLKRAMQRIAAARKERMKAKESERVPSYPDW